MFLTYRAIDRLTPQVRRIELNLAGLGGGDAPRPEEAPTPEGR